MSYNVVYKKQFIKLTDELFIPMTEEGCSSGRDYGTNRISRDWQNVCWIGRSKIVDKDKIFDLLEQKMLKRHADRNSNYGDDEKVSLQEYKDNYGYYVGHYIHGKPNNTRWSDFVNLIKTGIKQAMTVEELRANGVSITMGLYYGSEPEKHGLEDFGYVYPKTSEELQSEVERWEAYYGGKCSFSISFSGIDYFLEKKSKANAFKRRNAQKKELAGGYFSLKNDQGYFIKLVKYGYRWAHALEWARKFPSQKQAETFLKKNKGRLESLTVVEIKK